MPATLSLLMVSSIKPTEEYLNTEDFNVKPLEMGKDDKAVGEVGILIEE